MSTSGSDSGKACGCEGVTRGGQKAKCGCRGTESFEQWKEEILSKGCKGTKERRKKKEDSGGCEMFRTMSRKPTSQQNNCGCTCCSLLLCAAVLVAAGVTVAFIKKKYLD